MNKQILILLVLGLYICGLKAQKRKPEDTRMYHVNKALEIPLTVASYGFNVGYGFGYLSDQKGLSEESVLKLDRNDLWFFDRAATKQSVSYKDRAQELSDLFLNASIFLPGIIGLDKKVREEWMDIILMYLQLHAYNSTFYIGTAMSINRTRPIAYNTDAPMEARTEKGTRNSFFSGHVSTAASGCFFAAKVYSDLHPEIGNKKYLLYGAACIPPALVGYYRFKAMKHFPTDIITGFGMGALAGILVPELHKMKRKDSGIAFNPYVGEVSGLNIKYTFK
ncbi:phosphatase PAP2 family protein [Plebeiibacterium sediminum]|uniref:Phosphatase PAP2 family protein n=1 Tax=Plebeiibacterium sediminum TaxID=2992112 RepID=A0AAE3SGU1_9BACT|nr:phosphatase PAP2 family protein [Plebeiobacterium sediminum]MCW3788850.1 phosphatase PAP2 family protein [Plebeiobacterium sediminum]